MSKFVIQEKFWELFPQSEIGVLLVKGLDNKLIGREDLKEEIRALLDKGHETAKKYLGAEFLSENPAISVWREAYKKFKNKKGARSSIENLLKRVDKGNPLTSISPLVDIYNYVSLTYGIPCGGEDLDSFKGDLLLTKAEGGESFMALGDIEDDPALPGEIIYKDDLGAVCRNWNWRDGQRTMLTEGTKNAFLILESVDPSRHDDILMALDEMEKLVTGYLGGASKAMLLNIHNREMEFEF